MTDRDAALAALNTIIDPKSGKGLSDAGLVLGLIVREGRAGFAMEVRGEDVPLYQPVRDAAEAALKALPGLERVHVVLTSEEPPLAPGATRLRKVAIAIVNLEVPRGRQSSRRHGLCGRAHDRLRHRVGGEAADHRDVRLSGPSSGGQREHRIAVADRV